VRGVLLAGCGVIVSGVVMPRVIFVALAGGVIGNGRGRHRIRAASSTHT
jgi:hypothetical protein